MDLDELTTLQLRAEARARGVAAGGVRADLLERLRDHDGDDAGGDGGGSRRGESGHALGATIVRTARWLEGVTGGRVETVSRVEPLRRGAAVVYEVVELSTIPPAGDQLGTYEVVVDTDGEVVAYERRRRYRRADAG